MLFYYYIRKNFSILIVFLSAFTLYACASTEVMSPSSSVRNKIVDEAQGLVGSSYKYSGKGPKSFDCSGLVNYVYKKFDVNLSGSAASISKAGRNIDFSTAQAGDLVFFKKNGRIFHVSIIEKINSEELWVIHSTSSRGVIKEDILASPYWKTKIDKIISLTQISQQH